MYCTQENAALATLMTIAPCMSVWVDATLAALLARGA